MPRFPLIKSLTFGAVASLALLMLYVISMTLLSGWEATKEQFLSVWWLMIPLVIGFGIQVGLYMRLRETMKQKMNTAVAAGGTSAGVSMLACCVHHATDVIPFLGISGLSVFLTAYQIPLLALSLGINVFGIFVMLGHLRKIML